VANDRTLGKTLTRARYSDKMRIGTVGWHKEGHLVILVGKTARGFRRLRILQTREDDMGSRGWWPSGRILRGLFDIEPGTLLLTDKRVRQLEKELGINGRRQIRKVRKSA